MSLVSCAIVGYGRIGRLCHEIIRTNPALGFRVIGIADLEPVEVGINGATVTRNYRDLLGPGIDSVLIATPPAGHFEIASHAVAAGKHVWIEKPPSRTLPECKELIAQSRRSRSILFFAWHAIYNGSVELARRALAGATVSKITATYLENVLNFHSLDNWVHAEGVLRDSGVNALSVITRLLPQGVRLQVTGASVTGQPGRGVTRATGRFTFGQSGTATLQTDWNHTGEEVRRITVDSSHGQIMMDISRNCLTCDGRLLFGDPAGRNSLRSEYELMLQDFQACISTSTSKCGCEEMSLLNDIDRIAETQPSH